MLKSIQGLIVGCSLFVTVFAAHAASVNATAQWTYNGTNTEGGFRIEKKMPQSTAWVVEQDITDVAQRTLVWVFEATPGRTEFRLVAYAPIGDSPASDVAAFEYMEIPGLPAPTVILRFN